MCGERRGDPAAQNASRSSRTPIHRKAPITSNLDPEFQTMCLANARRPCRNFPRKNTLLNSCKESVIISRQGFTDFSGEQPQLSPTGLCMNYKGEVPETGF